MKKILVVDNDRTTLEFMKDILSKEEHDVVLAGSGLAALDILENYTPDVIFVDLVMPNIDGKRLCRIIRWRQSLKDVYLVILTAFAMEEDIDFAEIGADAYIAKSPFKEMAQHVLAAVDQSDLGSFRIAADEVIGANKIYPRKASEDLLSIKAHFETILESMSEGILEINSRGRVIYANPTALFLIGIHEEELLGSHFVEMVSKADRQRVGEFLKKWDDKPKAITEDSPVLLNSHQVTLDFIPLGGDEGTAIIILNDVTERKRAEEEKKKLEVQLQRAQKMEAVGALAGSVAHDLNSILSGIVGYPDLLLMQLPEDSPLRKPILAVKESGKKASAVVKDLLTLARRAIATMEAVNLNDVISEYLKSPEHKKIISYHPGIEVETNLGTGLLTILGSPVHLAKTVMNLVSNAAEAMPNGGKIIISTDNRYIDRPIYSYGRIEEGDYVTLRVSDIGMGMSSEDLERIFEPFYSKKQIGRSGSGLGMTVVWCTVKDHNGYIDVQSLEGKGSTFTLYFPITRDDIPKKEGLSRVEEFTGKGESILVVDDVEEQKEIAFSMLTTLGYSVVAVSGGEEALEYLKENAVDLIVLDMIMDPGINGLETYKRILELHPGQKAIIVSGFSVADLVQEAQRLGAGEYVKKPYTLEMIGMAVRAELDKQ